MRRLNPVGFIAALSFMVMAFHTFNANAVGSEKITGQPQVIEGDILKVGGQMFRLYGIDAPEMGQTCMGPKREYDCGRIATTGLMDLTAGVKSVTCEKKETGSDGITIARCLDPEGFDLSRQMIYTGWALALPDAGAGLHQLQAKSRQARRGLWKGEVTPPWDWRKSH